MKIAKRVKTHYVMAWVDMRIVGEDIAPPCWQGRLWMCTRAECPCAVLVLSTLSMLTSSGPREDTDALLMRHAMRDWGGKIDSGSDFDTDSDSRHSTS